MKMHEFLEDNRDELFEVCVRNLKHDAPERERAELGDHLRQFIDDVIRTLRVAEGIVDTPSTTRDSAAKLGHERHGRGFRIEQVAQTYATLSVSVGEVGGRHGVAFAAREYGVFNRAIDESVGAAIEQFTKDDRAVHAKEMTTRLGFLAHELRNALASARFASLLIESGEVATRGRTANVLQRALERMNTLIDQTLMAARLSEPTPPRVRPIHLSPLLHDIGEATVCERHVRLAIACDESIIVYGDDELITSAIGNLVQNAIKFSSDHSRVQLRARADGDDVVIEVEDACGGLPPGDPARLFEPFVQGSADRRGVGLGLAITRAAVAALNGTIGVRDVPGKGCVFDVRLRRREEEAERCSEVVAVGPIVETLAVKAHARS